MLATVKQIAADALRALHLPDQIAVREGPCASIGRAAHSCPKYDVVPRPSEVVVRFDVPAATRENTELWWNPEVQSLNLSVMRPGHDEGDLRAVLAFDSDVDGSRGIGTLKDGVLRVRLPRVDVDTLTGPPEAAYFVYETVAGPIGA